MSSFTLYVSADIASHAIMRVALEEIVKQSIERPYEFSREDAVEIAQTALTAANDFERTEEEQRGSGG